MNFEQISPLLGLPVTDPRLAGGLGAMGVDLARLALPEDDFRTYIEYQSAGIALVLTDEAYFLGRRDTPIGQGDLYLSGMFLYAEGVEGYSQYSYPLPFQLEFSNTREKVAALLGPSEWQRKRDDGTLWGERWLVDSGRRLHLTYKHGGQIAIVSYHVPDRAL